MAFDSARAKTLLFGGNDGKANLQDTWLWDGDNWKPAGNKHLPPRRSQHAMAYDPIRQVVILFGGEGGGKPFGDTWEWNGYDWIKRTPPKSPPARFAHAMAYDGNTGRILLFGGFDGRSFLDDHWEWDGKTWTPRSFKKKPLARAAHAMAYDPLRKRMVLFGGGSGFSDYSDTWEWDGKVWTQMSPTNKPPAREGHAMAFDINRKSVLLFSGWSRGQRKFVFDAWTYSGGEWVVKFKEGFAPQVIGTMSLDSLRKKLVIFGKGRTFESTEKSWAAFFGVTFPRGLNGFYFDSNLESISYLGKTLNGRGYLKSQDRTEWLRYVDGYWVVLDRKIPSLRSAISHLYLMNVFFDRVSNKPAIIGYFVFKGAQYTVVMEYYKGKGWFVIWANKGVLSLSFPTLSAKNGFNYFLTDKKSFAVWNGKSLIRGLYPPFSQQKRSGISVAYSRKEEAIYLLAHNPSFKGMVEIYKLLLERKTWEKISGPTGMESRLNQVVWWDPTQNKLMLYGGKGPNGKKFGDVWVLTDKKWFKVVTKNNVLSVPGSVVIANEIEGKIEVFRGKKPSPEIWEFYDNKDSRFSSFGEPCIGLKDGPILIAKDPFRPILGEKFEVVTIGLPTSSNFEVLCIGFSRRNWLGVNLPFDLGNMGLTGCKLFISPDILLPILNMGGKASWSIRLPKDPLLNAKRFFVQAFVFDAKANKAGVTVSNGGEAIMGFRR
jgi:hypothetical protein